MNARKKRSGIWFAYVAVDLFCILVAFYLPYLLRYLDYYPPGTVSLPEKWDRLGDWALGPYTLVFLIWTGLCLLLLEHYRLYRTDRGLSYLDESLLVAKAVLLASLSAAGAIFLLQVKIYSRMVFLLNVVLLFATLSGWRWAKRWLVRRRVSKGFNNRNVLIAGSGPVGVGLAGLLAANRHLGLELVGYLADAPAAADLPAPVLGRLDEVESVIRKYFVDEVLVALDPREERFPELVRRARRLGVGVMVTPGILGADPADVRVNYLGRVPLLEYQEKGIHGADLFLKRGFDIAGSLAGLALLSPLFLAIAAAVRLGSAGPVIYASRRCGRKGKTFRFFKFRTMLPGADALLEDLRHLDETDGPVFKIRNDPRVTRCGRFLRRYSLDELPQLWNVLRGDMSLVGPRPPTPEEVERYEEWQLRRLEIRPGLTCLWQVSGRSNLSFSQWMKLDLYYIDNWSFWLDLKILLRTGLAVFRGEGAY